MTAVRSKAEGTVDPLHPRVGAAAGASSAPPQPPGRSAADPAALVSTGLLAVCVAALWFVSFVAVLSGFQEHGAQARLYAQLRSQLANETAAVAAPVGPGQPVALISAPRAGIDREVVVEGSTAGQLAAGPGHVPDTPLPGQVGDSFVLGRALAYGGPFGRITSLRIGDPVTVTTGQGTFVYRVQDVRRAGARLPVPLTGSQSRLTLVTAAPGWLGPLSPASAVYVDAMLSRGTAQPLPAPLPAIGAASLPMQGDRSALVPLIFWLEALAVGEVLVVLAWRRWGRWQTWVVGLPLMAGLAWGVSGSLIRLLPNLL